MSELACPECGNDVPVGSFPVEEGTLATCGVCKRHLAVFVDCSSEWRAPDGTYHGVATLIVQDEDDAEGNDCAVRGDERD